MQLHEVLECALSPEELLARVNVRMGPERRALGEKAALLRARFPAQVDKALEKAGLALQDMVVLPGTMGKPYFAGDPPRWYANPVNDNEYTWQLNRMGHWETLLWAYALTQDDRCSTGLRTALGPSWCPSTTTPSTPGARWRWAFACSGRGRRSWLTLPARAF
jgi:hypothetical protein